MKFLIVLVAVSLISGCAGVCGRVESEGFGVVKDDGSIRVRFGENDIRLIKDYYAKSKKALPPGLAKKSQLPPGLQKQLMRNGKLPPGLEKRSLPIELERKLSPLPKGYVRLKVGENVLILKTNTDTIVDIIYNI
jgi:hypothetical protein